MLGHAPLGQLPLSTLEDASSGTPTIISLDSATFNFDGQDITLIRDTLIELTTATFLFTTQAISTFTSLTIELTSALFLFTAQSISVVSAAAGRVIRYAGLIVNVGRLKGRR
jgi:hypothetical protein